MKKFAVLTLALILLVTLVACGNNSVDTPAAETTNPSSDTVAEATDPIDETENSNIPSSFREIPSENLLEAYRNEVKYRKSQEDYFTYEEKVFLASKGYDFDGWRALKEYNNRYLELEEYYYPVVYRVGEDILIFSSDGRLDVEGEYSVAQEYETWEYVHNPKLAEDEELLVCDYGYSVVYNQTTGSVSGWEFGEKMAEYQVPVGSVYTGWSYWEGFIFRKDTEVYAVKDYCYVGSEGAGVYLLAENVQQVVLADYYAGSDEWSQPLFLMTDGSLKVYCSWYGDSNAPIGDPCHLQDITYEGGYKQP